MSTHDDRQHEHDIGGLRRDYASLPRNEPRPEIDAAIRAAARRNARRRHWPAWGAAAGLAACVGLAVVLVPALLVEGPVATVPVQTTELVLRMERVADERYVLRKQRETAATPAAAPAGQEGKGERSMAHEEWIAREEVAPQALHSPVPRVADDVRDAEQGAQDLDGTSRLPSGLDRVVVTGSRIRPADAEAVAPDIDSIRAELANADEPAWRARLLQLHAEGGNAAALALLAEFRERFDRPADFTLDDLARESSRAEAEKE